MDIVDVKQHHERTGVGRVYGWHTVPVDQAMKLADPRIRCPECKGAVGLYSASDNRRMPRRAEHKVANPGCSLGDNFDGQVRPARMQIEPEQESYQS
jgi:hypothetical protein